MGKIPLMIYVEADVREWIRTKAFNNRTTMTSVVVDALRSQNAEGSNRKRGDTWNRCEATTR